MKFRIFSSPVNTNTAASTNTSATTSTSSTQRIEIPKIIHFIWAGGTLRMPDDNLVIVLQWLINNPDWKIFIWVDSKTDAKVLEGRYYQKACRRLLEEEEVFEVLEKSIKEKLLQQIVIQDIAGQVFDNEQSSSTSATSSTSSSAVNAASSANTINFRNEYVAYEIGKLRPNYGASSDELRYEINYEYGGAYFDSDVHSGATPLSSIALTNLAHHVLYFEHYSQYHDATPGQLANFEALGSVGNDAFICSKHNPLMLRLLRKAQENYKCEDELEQTKAAYGGRNIRHVTVTRTGPGVVADLVAESELGKEHRMLDGVELRRLRDGKIQLSVPAKTNDTNWLKVGMPKKEYNEALTAVANTIAFEAKHFNVIRIDDHINDMLTATRDALHANNEDFREANRKLIVVAIIAEADKHIKEDTLLQVTGLFPEALKHFSKQKTLFLLKDESLGEALSQLLRPQSFDIGLTPKAIDAMGSKVTTWIYFVEENIGYMEGILNNFHRFSREQVAIVVKKMTSYITDYLLFVDILIAKKIELDRMVAIKKKFDGYLTKLSSSQDDADTPTKAFK